MNASGYLQGAHPQAIVPDLVPAGVQPLEALFIFESPHYDELRSGTPLAGSAGKLAMNYAMNRIGSPEGLGPWLAHKFQTGNARIAIANVSQVPLQEKAFDHPKTISLKPVLTEREWGSLERVRTASPSAWQPEEERLGQLLTQGLQDRIDGLKFGAHAKIVPCGRFAKHFVDALRLPQGIATLPVPHPAQSQWQQAKGQAATNLMMARDILLRNVPCIVEKAKRLHATRPR